VIQIRPASERGHIDHGWLNTWHTFSFADYFDPEHHGFRSLRVMNEDFIQPGEGFGTHGHRDMEILTYVLSGKLEHRDSLGNGGILQHHLVQHMRAGTGIRHSEANASDTDELHLYQIWILPAKGGLVPNYVDKTFDPAEAQGKLQLLASPGGRNGSLDIAQDAFWYRTFLQPGQSVSLSLTDEHHAWVQVVNGTVTLNSSSTLSTGDGAAMSGEKELVLKAEKESEVLVFELG
jgi:redox-sensitive bicupin YhaK (pirin superfamily)